MAYDFKTLEEKISSATKRFESESASLRTGRASPALVQDLKIEAYGETNSLKNLASISTEDAKTISVQPWDKSLLEAIEKGINNSALGLRASAAKDKVRVVLPAITQERRQALLKLLKEKLEETRVSLRKARDEVWKDIQEKERSKAISEDEKFRLKEQMEEKIKTGAEKLDEVEKKKEREIME